VAELTVAAPLTLCVLLIALLTGCGDAGRPAADDLTTAQLEQSCAFPPLDGAGATADEIPVAHTPHCGYTTFPAPVLAACHEPLAAGVPDLRGVWLDASRPHGHLERIEQCGDRVTITAGGVVHDMRTDNSYADGVNDVSARGCVPISVRAEFVSGVHTLHPKWLPLTVTRRLEGNTLMWDYPTGVYRLTRLCAPGAPGDANSLAARLRRAS
jgi:hypothetical protein